MRGSKRRWPQATAFCWRRCSSPTATGATCWRSPGASGRSPAPTAIVGELAAHAARARPTAFELAPGRTPPRRVTRAGTQAIEAIFRFETAEGRGSGVVRLVPDADDGDAEGLDAAHGARRDQGARRAARTIAALGRGLFTRFSRARTGSTPGRPRPHTPIAIPPCWSSAPDKPGLSIAARLGQLQVDTLIVDRERAHRRQLAPSLSRAGSAQPGARQSLSLHAVPAELAGLHPEGQAGRVVRGLCGQHGAQLLDRHRIPRRPLRRNAGALVGRAPPRRRHHARDASAARRDGDRGQRHPEPSGHSDAEQLRRHGPACEPIPGRRRLARQAGDRHRLRHQRPRHRAGPARQRREGHARPAQLDHGGQCRAERAASLCAL